MKPALNVQQVIAIVATLARLSYLPSGVGWTLATIFATCVIYGIGYFLALVVKGRRGPVTPPTPQARLFLRPMTIEEAARN